LLAAPTFGRLQGRQIEQAGDPQSHRPRRPISA
jgi:hypothetical protein